MSHDRHNPVTFIRDTDGQAIDGCRATVEVPKIDQTLIFSAAALDKNAKAPKDLGYAFAEKVTLSCSPPKP